MSGLTKSKLTKKEKSRYHYLKKTEAMKAGGCGACLNKYRHFLPILSRSPQPDELTHIALALDQGNAVVCAPEYKKVCYGEWRREIGGRDVWNPKSLRIACARCSKWSPWISAEQRRQRIEADETDRLTSLRLSGDL